MQCSIWFIGGKDYLEVKGITDPLTQNVRVAALVRSDAHTKELIA